YPFAIFQVRALSRFSLFAPISDLSSTQRVRVSTEGITSGIVFKKIEPALEVNGVSAAVHAFDPALPYISYLKSEVLKTQCTLTNRTNHNVAGYAQTFLSDIGEAEPWKNFESAGDMEEFFLDPGQSITMDLPVNTDGLTGDHELSYWVFTRQDLPFSPQNGGWFNKQIRVSDPKLGIHPVYGIPIP
ncbi:MAG TPA: hypothetical protein VFG11_01625, partial [Acidobacteriota bacterium]|nr:hypothetical protein [Acidobacteriota bacterium]